MKIQVKNGKISACIFLVIMALLIAYLSSIFMAQWQEEAIYPSADVDEIKMLSEYYPDLKGTPMDTEVFIFRGEKPGAAMLVLGNTHPTEPSALLSTTLILENAQVEEGDLYIIPRTNKSAMTHSDPQDANPMGVHIETPNGTRYFRVGSRFTNPIHQWPDPDIYYHNAGQLLAGRETRNVDRTYPGDVNGNLTEQLCYGIIELVKAEGVDFVIDTHEGPPEYPTINVMITHQKAMDLAGLTALNCAFAGIDLRIDPSPVNLHGFSHREIGDHTDAMAVLVETTNPVQGRLTGKKSEDLVLYGKDKFYTYASENSDRLYTEYPEEGITLDERVARHVETIMQLAVSYNELERGEQLIINNIPYYDDIIANGIGAYLPIK